MRLRLRALIVLTICLLCPLQNLWGWNAVGHMAVAWVAYQKLTAQQKARVTTLLTLNPAYNTWLGFIPAGTSDADRDTYVFMMAATWPDEIKSSNSGFANDGNTPPSTPEASANIGYTDLVMHKYWHFVDVPFSTDGTPTEPAPSVNAQTEIDLFRAAIATDEADPLKSYDLAWLMHLIGDVHQPLHCTSRYSADATHGDAGGNSVKLHGSPNNLHSYWDDLLGNGSTQNYTTALTAAKMLGKASKTQAADLKTADWIHESFTYDKITVYKTPIAAGLGPYTITAGSSYDKKAHALAKKRIALAGARLAAVINAELK